MIVPAARLSRTAIALALAACLFGCGVAPVGERIDVLTGVDGCWAGGEQGVRSRLVADAEHGARFHDRPVMWPLGFTGVRLVTGEVAILDENGKVVAETGKNYYISYAPVFDGAKQDLMERLNAFPAAANCGYPWDLREEPFWNGEPDA